MKIIDCHTHPIFKDPLLIETSIENKIDFSYKGLLTEMKENNVEKIVAISTLNKENKIIEELGRKNENILPVAYASPFHLKSLKLLEMELREGKFRAIKLYPGYEYFYANSKKCEPIYKMAERLGVPVIFHSGVIWSKEKKARNNFSRPMPIDDVAVSHPDLKILIAHAGNPWVNDVAAIVYARENVFTDFSGWFESKIEKNYAKVMRGTLQFLLAWTSPEKILYGTDWPLVKMKPYIKFVKSIGIPKHDLRKIMYKNAVKLFWKG
jgi:predicted TIM-barrel fold metal-dependent hydrolase